MILMINDRFYNEAELRQLIQSQAEQIRRLKKMLLQACSDFDAICEDNNIIQECSHWFKYQTCEGCPLNNNSDGCKWIYEPEALELIGKVQNDIK